MYSSSTTNTLYLKEILPDFTEYGNKKAKQTAQLNTLLQTIKEQQTSYSEVMSDFKQELNALELEVNRIQGLIFHPFNKLQYMYNKIMDQIEAILDSKRKAKKRKRYIKKGKSHQTWMSKYLDNSVIRDVVKPKQDISNVKSLDKDNKSEGETSRRSFSTTSHKKYTFRRPNVEYKPRKNRPRKVYPIPPSVDRNNSPRKRFLCQCNQTVKMNISEYIIHKQLKHSGESQNQNKVQTQKIGTPSFYNHRNETKKVVKEGEIHERGKSPCKEIVYEVVNPRRLY